MGVRELNELVLVIKDELPLFADTLSGVFLPIQLLYQGKTDRYHAKFTFQMVSTQEMYLNL